MKDDVIVDLTEGLSSFGLYQVYMTSNQMKSQNRLFHSIKSFSQKICVNTLVFTWLNSASGVDTPFILFYFILGRHALFFLAN